MKEEEEQRCGVEDQRKSGRPNKHVDVEKSKDHGHVKKKM